MPSRYERGRITPTRGSRSWAEVFPNPVVASAVIDRLAHHAHMVPRSGQRETPIRFGRGRGWHRSSSFAFKARAAALQVHARARYIERLLRRSLPGATLTNSGNSRDKIARRRIAQLHKGSNFSDAPPQRGNIVAFLPPSERFGRVNA